MQKFLQIQLLSKDYESLDFLYCVYRVYCIMLYIVIYYAIMHIYTYEFNESHIMFYVYIL